MKIFSALAWLAASIFFLPFAAISQCSPTAKGIYTDPQSPYWANPEVNPNWQTTNNGLFGRKNTFDWTALNVKIYEKGTGIVTIDGSCKQFLNPIIVPIADALDYRAEDGWEMVFWNTGIKDDNNSVYPTTPTNSPKPIIILYNKFTGLLRVFGVLYLNAGTSFATVKINLSLPTVGLSTYRHASLLDASGVAALLSPMDRFTIDNKANTIMTSISKYYNNQYSWFYADFPTTYDPCTCDWLSRINIEVYLVTSMSIEMVSQTTGTATAMNSISTADSNSTSNKFVFGEHLADAAEASWKSYENINNFVEEAQKRINEVSGSTEVKKEANGAVDKLTKALSSKEWGALSKGLAFIPYVGAAVSLISAFTAGGKKETPTTTISIPPLVLHSTETFHGTITQDAPYVGINFWNPGSAHQPIGYTSLYPVGSVQYIPEIEEKMRQYPLYNRTMGILNLVTTPKLEVYTSPLFDESTYSFDTSRYEYNIYCKKSQNRYFKLEPIEYALNPESELEIQEIYAAFVLDAYPNIFPPKGSFWNKLGNTYQSEFIPLSSLTGQGFGGKWSRLGEYSHFGYPGDSPDYTSCNPIIYFPDNFDQTVKLKLMFNLKRTDQYAGPETQNVLWVGTYPVKTEATTTPILPSVLNTSALNGSQILKNTLLQNITINNDIYCWDTLRIGPGVTFTNTTPITLQAGQVIEISPTVEIPTNVTLLIAPLFPHTGFPAPMTYTNIRTYCQTAYSQARSSKSNPKTLEEPTLAQPIIATALTAQPNPFSETLTLRFGPETGTLTVYDVLGRAISSSEVAADQQQLDLSTAEWQPGVYIAVYETAAGRQAVRVVRQ